MKYKALLVTIISLPLWLTAFPVRAENPEHLRQLLSTKQCQKCNLRTSGLAYGNLSGADLQGADLSGANLSRANLSGANLSGANLAGASLYGANLSGANLSNAILTNADLQDSYLHSANLEGADLNGTLLKTAIAIPATVAKADDYYRWAIEEDKKGNYNQAIEHYSQAIALKPKLAGAYLGRAIARYRFGDMAGGLQDAQQAEVLFAEQSNAEGHKISQTVAEEMKKPKEARLREGSSNFVNFLGSLSSLLLNFLL